jgi:hypothetical protein
MLRNLIMMERGLSGNTANASDPLGFFLYAAMVMARVGPLL